MHWIDQAPSASKSSQCESESQVGPPKEQWEKKLKGLCTGKSARDGAAPSDRVSAMPYAMGSDRSAVANIEVCSQNMQMFGLDEG